MYTRFNIPIKSGIHLYYLVYEFIKKLQQNCWCLIKLYTFIAENLHKFIVIFIVLKNKVVYFHECVLIRRK